MKHILLIIGTLALFAALSFWKSGVEPQVAASLAVDALNGGSVARTSQIAFEDARQGIATCVAIAWSVVLLMAYRKPIMKKLSSIAVILLAVGLTGCMKPYDKPEYVEIGTSETAFVIPLEGDTKAQAKFDSEAYLEQRKVSAKRIQIPHRWNQTGRFSHDGEWIDAVRVIKVDRSPVTRQWSATSENAKAGSRTASGAIWIESNDSIGFSMGFNCTAYIAEADASKFLYWYKGDSLATVMDSEIKARYQQAAAETAAKVKIDLLREKKQDIVDAIRADIIPFFKERGITITTVGQFGGMTYENAEIQSAIDKTFIAQQEKVVAAAQLAAQDDKNKKIEKEADALAEKARREAKGQADAKTTVAIAEAQALREVTKAASEANQNPMVLQLRQLEIEKARIEKWNGNYPTYYMGGQSPQLLMQMPSVK